MAEVPAPVVISVRQQLVTCGMNDTPSFNGQSDAERVASEAFMDDYHTAMDKDWSDLDSKAKPA